MEHPLGLTDARKAAPTQSADVEWREDRRQLAWSRHPHGVLAASVLQRMALAIHAVVRQLSRARRPAAAPLRGARRPGSASEGALGFGPGQCSCMSVANLRRQLATRNWKVAHPLGPDYSMGAIMSHRHDSMALAFCALAAGCSTPPPDAPKRAERAQNASEGMVRVGAVLRLARAGVIEEVRGVDGGTEAVVLVPAARGSTTWQRGVDTQGNQFRVAPGGRLVPEGEPQPDREPASVANVAYYFAQSLALMVSRYRRQGLAMAAEVLDLPSKDPVVATAQRRLCVLFGRVGLAGNILEKLYQNLGAVPHRTGGQVEVRNHVHGFSVHVPLGWTLLAGPLPDLGPKATGLVFALPNGWGGKGEGQANLMWTTSLAPQKGDLALFATQRRLATPASSVHPLRLAVPSGVVGILAQRVEPLDYQGRHLRSWQVFIQDRGLIHHLALLAPRDTHAASAGPVLEALMSTFQVTTWVSPCEPK